MVGSDLAGRPLYPQAYVVDPAAHGGLSCSNGLELAFDREAVKESPLG